MDRALFSNLSENYRRRITATLTLLDKTVCEFEELARGRETRSVLYSERNGLSAIQRELILEETAAIRDALRRLIEDLDLQAHPHSAAELIWSQCSSLWASLAEIDGKRLKGYGEAPPGFTGYWDPRLAQLGERVKRILEIFHTT